MIHLTTYFDRNYLSRGLVMYDSLKEHNVDFELYVLCLDDFTSAFFKQRENAYPQVKTIVLSDIEIDDSELRQCKSNRSLIEYYFTLSPNLPLFLLKKYNLPHICSLDADIFFLGSPTQIFKYLNNYSIVITPHKFSDELKASIKYGYFNVSFQIFKNDKTGIECLEFWRTKCIEWCGDIYEEKSNRFADQKYLDSWPALYTNKLKVLDDNVSGIAPWNLNRFNITKQKKTFYSNQEKLIFYHFHDFKFLNKNWALNGFHTYHVKKTPTIDKLYLIYWNKIINYNTLLSFSKDHSIRKVQTDRVWDRLESENYVYFRLGTLYLFNIVIDKLPANIKKILAKMYT